MVDADDAVGHGLAVCERYRPLGTRIHGCLRLGVELARVALFPDVLGHGLLVIERPVGWILFLQLLDPAVGPTASTAGISASGPTGAVCLGELARDVVAGLRDLPGDLIAEGKKPCADHDRNEDDDDVLDGSGTLLGDPAPCELRDLSLPLSHWPTPFNRQYSSEYIDCRIDRGCFDLSCANGSIRGAKCRRNVKREFLFTELPKNSYPVLAKPSLNHGFTYKVCQRSISSCPLLNFLSNLFDASFALV